MLCETEYTLLSAASQGWPWHEGHPQWSPAHDLAALTRPEGDIKEKGEMMASPESPQGLNLVLSYSLPLLAFSFLPSFNLIKKKMWEGPSTSNNMDANFNPKHWV